MDHRHFVVHQQAAGSRAHYRLDPAPLRTGGQAHVFRAEHKSTGTFVAMKRLRIANELAKARMRREIEVAAALEGTPNVMPVLDAAADHTWMVMPLADRNLEETREARAFSDSDILDLLEQLAVPLAAAHEAGYVHRDIQPRNVLWLDGQWVLADWGLVRNPPGMTTVQGRTVTGRSYGTEGFAAPEMARDAHGADLRTDVYSLGQLIGWLMTVQWPVPNTPLVPNRPPWNHAVRRATRRDPTRRPASVDELVDGLRRQMQAPAILLVERAEDLLEDAIRLSGRGSLSKPSAARKPLEELLDLAEDAWDEELYIDVLSRLPGGLTRYAVLLDLERSHRIIDLFQQAEYDSYRVQFSDANRVILWLLSVAQAAAHASDVTLFEDSVDCMLDWDDRWDQWNAQDKVSAWMRTLDDDAATIVAELLRRHPDARHHFAPLADDRSTNRRLRAILTSGSA